MTPEELEEVYTDLCNRLTAIGDAKLADGLARVALLLMHEIDDAVRLTELFDDALSDFAALPGMEGPWRAATSE